MAGSEKELAILLPIIPIETQREKANIAKEIEDMITKEVDKNINISSIEVINILLGVSEQKVYQRY